MSALQRRNSLIVTLLMSALLAPAHGHDADTSLVTQVLQAYKQGGAVWQNRVDRMQKEMDMLRNFYHQAR